MPSRETDYASRTTQHDPRRIVHPILVRNHIQKHFFIRQELVERAVFRYEVRQLRRGDRAQPRCDEVRRLDHRRGAGGRQGRWRNRSARDTGSSGKGRGKLYGEVFEKCVSAMVR